MVKGKNVNPSNFITDVAGAKEGEWYHENELTVSIENLCFASENGAIFRFLNDLYIDISVYKK